MRLRTQEKKKKTQTTGEMKVNYSKALVKEVEESIDEFKNGKYFKGTANDVIMKLKDEAHKDKKI